MIDVFFNYRYGELEYRLVRFETETFTSNNHHGNAVINFTDVDTPYTRSIEWRHFDNKADDGKTLPQKNIHKIGTGQ